MIILALTIVSCKASVTESPTASPAITASASPSAAPSDSTVPSGSPAPSVSDAAVPYIAGSNLKDVTSILEQSGFPENTTPNPSEYVSNTTDTKTGTDLSCDVYFAAQDNNAVISASFTAQSSAPANADFLAAAQGYLISCSAMPYQGADAASVKTWIEANIKSATLTGTTKTVGDALFTLYGNLNEAGVAPAVWIEISKAGT